MALIHKWSSIICTAFLLILCATGLPLIFSDEINGALAPVTRQMPVTSERERPLDTTLARALAQRRGEVPMSLTRLQGGERRLILWSAPRAMAQPRDFHGTLIDLRDGAVLGRTSAAPD